MSSSVLARTVVAMAVKPGSSRYEDHARGYDRDMSTSDQPPPIPRDLSTDEPDLPSDAELEAMAPPLPPLDTDPMPPMPPVAPGPEESRPPIEGAPQPTNSLEEIAEREQRLQ